MINIKYENETFWVKGSLDLGYLGKYINETWQSVDDNPMISIEDYNKGILGIIEDLRENNDSDGYGWKFLGEYLKKDEYNHEKIIQAMENYFNKQEEKIKKNIKQFNSNFLSFIFDELCSTEYPFWENSNAIIQEYMPKEYESNKRLEEIIYEPVACLFQELYDEYFDGSPNDGTINKPDIENMIRNHFPMFNLDGLISTLNPGSIILYGDTMSFQCDDGWGSNILCSTYAEVERNLSFNDWHNH